MQKGYITFDEGAKLAGPKAFSALTKPIGSLCNLNCTYCYYLDKERFYGKQQPVMSDDMLEAYIKEYIQTNEIPEISFVWHGGEPLMAGIEYFKKAIDFQRKHNTEKKPIHNSIQTNATLLNDEWCKFFRKNKFLVGVSIDGPQDIHNTYRKNRGGFNTFERVIKGIDLLKKHKVDFNSLSVVNDMSEGRGREVYLFLKSIGIEFMQFLPCIDYISDTEVYEDRPIIVSPLITETITDSHIAPWSVSSNGYGQFLIDIFNEWVTNDVGQIFVQLFDMTLCAWCNVDAAVCAYRESCGDVLAVEHNGDVYSCDHFVFPEHKLGNIKEDSLSEMLRSDQQIRFGLNKRNTLSRECTKCTYYFACKGECPKHRHLDTLDGEKKFSLCEGIQMYYKHTEPFMKFMRDQLIQQKPPSNVIPWARTILQ